MKIKLSIIIPVYNQASLVLHALNSISPRDDIEIIVVDDCSTDDTLAEIMTYQKYTDQNIVLLHNNENMGVGYSVNRGLDVATGEYITLLGSDDYFLTNELNYCIDHLLNGTDIVYYDLQINDGTIFHLSEDTKWLYCGSTKFIKLDFIGDTRNQLLRAREDWYFYQELLNKKPTEMFSNKVVKHYNYPRINSLTDLAIKGKI